MIYLTSTYLSRYVYEYEYECEGREKETNMCVGGA